MYKQFINNEIQFEMNELKEISSPKTMLKYLTLKIEILILIFKRY